MNNIFNRFICLLIICCSILNFSIAQTLEGNKLLIPDYDGSAAIIIENNNQVKIQKGDQVLLLPTKNVDQELLFLNDIDKEKATQLLGIANVILPSTVSRQAANKDAITTLINLANTQKDKKIIIATSTVAAINPENEELINAPTPTTTTENNWLLPLCLGLGGTLIGFLLGWLFKKPKIVTDIIEKEVYIQAPTSDAPEKKPRKTKADSNLNALQTTIEEQNTLIEKLQATEKQLNAALKQATQFDEIYYEKVFNELILPMQKAINVGDINLIFKYIIQASIQLQSIARYKTNKKLKYDEQNIAIILNTKYDIQEYPIISKETPLDQTPKNLQTIISILKQLGIKEIAPYVFQGYIIKELND